MSRIRTIKPEFWASPKVGRVSRDARLCLLGLLNEADDEGRLIDSPRRLLGVLFSYDIDLDDEDVDALLNELARARLIYRYEVDGFEYIEVHGFDHQRIDKPKPSRLPPRPNDAVPPAGAIHDVSPTPPRTIREGLDQGREGIREGSGVEPLAPALVAQKPLSIFEQQLRDIEPKTPDEALAYRWGAKSHAGKTVGEVWQTRWGAILDGNDGRPTIARAWESPIWMHWQNMPQRERWRWPDKVLSAAEPWMQDIHDKAQRAKISAESAKARGIDVRPEQRISEAAKRNREAVEKKRAEDAALAASISDEEVARNQALIANFSATIGKQKTAARGPRDLSAAAAALGRNNHPARAGPPPPSSTQGPPTPSHFETPGDIET